MRFSFATSLTTLVFLLSAKFQTNPMFKQLKTELSKTLKTVHIVVHSQVVRLIFSTFFTSRNRGNTHLFKQKHFQNFHRNTV